MSKKFKKYLEIQKKHNAYKFAFATIEFDAETIAPKNGFEIRGEMLGLLGAEDFKIITNKKYLKLLNNLNECKKLKADQKRMIELSIKDAEELEKLPKELYKKSINLTNNAYMIWQNAKNKSDFELYMPTLNEVINLQKEKLAYFTKKDNYDYLLDTFEPGFSKKDYDNFFDNFKTEILPSLSKIEGNKLPEFLLAKYDIAKQKEFNDILMEYLGVDKNTFYCGETEHPFSSQLSMKDVRFCTKYQEKNFIDSIFSTIHELGHSFFQAYINEKYAFTPIETNISMGLHESQSRLLENYIGRSKSF
jgi:carboxypeptidase Taq